MNEGVDETAGDFSEDDSAMPLFRSASPQRTATNRFGLPRAVPVQTSLEPRLEKLNADLADADEKVESEKVENQAKLSLSFDSSQFLLAKKHWCHQARLESGHGLKTKPSAA